MEQAVVGAGEHRAVGDAESAALEAVTAPDGLHYVVTTVISHAHRTILPDSDTPPGPAPARTPRFPVSVLAMDRVRDLLGWSDALAGIARTGLAFTESLYERERFEEILRVAADMRYAAQQAVGSPLPPPGEIVEEWMRSIGEGVAGYVTPKVAIGAVVGNDAGEILLVQRSDSGGWLYPTGWADVGYSPSEIVVKEVKEETNIDVEPLRLIAVFDGLRLGFTRIPLYSLVFHCRAIGGELAGHPLECSAVGWFSQDALPSPLIGEHRWVRLAFAALRGEPVEVAFDMPRDPPWRGDEEPG